MSLTPLDELGLLLRPAGDGVYAVSTGKTAQQQFQRAYYGEPDLEATQARWRTAVVGVASARVAILGVPSDCGAGLVRGAAFGPQAIRAALAEADHDFVARMGKRGVVDLGDVRVVPHLLHDEMVSDSQRAACQAALYPGVKPADAAHLPVAPLSIAERVITHLLTMNPRLRIMLLGGDHSVAWPMVAALGRHLHEPWAIVQPDAHTDLLPERLGVRYCFASWAYHANEVLGRQGRLVQVGVRASAYPRQHWEQTLGVRQFWANEIRARGDAFAIDDVVAHLQSIGIKRVYFSNDIDGTDAALAPSTGAPEPGGVSAGFVKDLIARLGSAFSLIGADLVEVAPPVGSDRDRRLTVALAADYTLASIEALLSSPVA